MRKYADVEHVGVRQDQVRPPPDRRAFLARRVPVVDRQAQPAGRDLGQLAGLILGQRLGRVEVEGPRLRVPADRVEHRHVERQRLARRGAAGDDHVRGLGGPQGLELVGVEGAHPGALERRPQSRVELRGQRHLVGLLLAFGALGDEPAVGAARIDRRPPRLVDRRAPGEVLGGEVLGASHASERSAPRPGSRRAPRGRAGDGPGRPFRPPAPPRRSCRCPARSPAAGAPRTRRGSPR